MSRGFSTDVHLVLEPGDIDSAMEEDDNAFAGSIDRFDRGSTHDGRCSATEALGGDRDLCHAHMKKLASSEPQNTDLSTCSSARRRRPSTRTTSRCSGRPRPCFCSSVSTKVHMRIRCTHTTRSIFRYSATTSLKSCSTAAAELKSP